MAAQEMILKLLFNDEGTFVGLEQINQELAKTDRATKGVENSTKSLKAQYADLKKQQDQFDPGTEKFNQLSQKMGELKDRMNDAADAVKGNTGPAIEGMGNTFGIMGDQLKNLDFEGLTQSLGTLTSNLGRVDTKALAGGFKEAFKAGIAGIKALGKAILANPILLLVAAIVAVIAYWEELSDLVSGKSAMLEGLKKQAETLKQQEQSLGRQLAMQKALGLGAAAILKTELDMLENKQKQAEAAMEIAILEDDRAAFLEAQNTQLQAINEKEMRKIKINTDAQALLDKIRAGKDDEYNKQLLQNQAFAEYKKATEELGVLQQANSQKVDELQKQINQAQLFGNKQLQEKLRLEQQSLLNTNISLQANKDEIWNAGEAAKSEVKTAEELAAIEKAKAKQAERKAKKDADAKKLREDVLSIEQRIAEINRSAMDEQEQELFNLFAKQKIEEDTYKLAKKSAEERAALLQFHKEEEQLIRDKYALIEYNEQVAADKLIAQEFRDKYNSIKDIAADQAKDNELRLLSEKDKELKINKDKYDALIAEADLRGIDTKVFLDAQLSEEDAIKKKYSDKEIAREEEKAAIKQANLQKNFDMTSLALDALSSLNEATTKGDEASQRKAFERNKMIQKGQAIIAMASGIVQQLAVPQDQLKGINFLKAAAVAAVGAANIVKINQTQFSGGGTPPSTNLNDNTGGGMNAPAIDFSGGQFDTGAPGTVETYVLAGNVANALEARQKIIDQSHL